MTRRSEDRTSIDTTRLCLHVRPMKPLILASTSPYRKQLLESVGMPFVAVAPKFDEETLKSKGTPVLELCETLAFKKAESLKSDHPEQIIIGSDQMAHIDGEILGKAGSAEKAADQLLRLAGRTHELITSLAVLSGETTLISTVVAKLTMRDLTADQAARIVERDQTWDCAGSYKLEKSGLTLFDKIETEDHSAIIGLPILRLCQSLTELGVEFPFLED